MDKRCRHAIRIGFFASAIYITIFILMYVFSWTFLPGEPLSYTGILSIFPCIILFPGEAGATCVFAGPILNAAFIFLMAMGIGYLMSARKSYK